MKTMASVITLMFAIASGSACADYSNGMRVGVIDKIGTKGIFITTIEGNMMLGKGSVPSCKLNEDGEQECINPWNFSAPLKMAGTINQFVGVPAVVYYSQSLSNIQYDTAYVVTSIEPQRKLTPDVPKVCVHPASQNAGSYSKSGRIGRIVKMSTRGMFKDSYEVIIQQGAEGGNLFIEMSIADAAMYKCVWNQARTGKLLNVEYAQSWLGNIGQDTDYTIWKTTLVGN